MEARKEKVEFSKLTPNERMSYICKRLEMASKKEYNGLEVFDINKNNRLNRGGL